MSEPVKPKRRVTAQIPLASSSTSSRPILSPTASYGSGTSTPSHTYPTRSSSSASGSSTPIIRARIDPLKVSGGASTPTPASTVNHSTTRPTLRSTPSSTSTASSVRTSISSPSVPTIGSRPRSPVRVKSPLLGSGESTPLAARARARPSSPAFGNHGIVGQGQGPGQVQAASSPLNPSTESAAYAKIKARVEVGGVSVHDGNGSKGLTSPRMADPTNGGISAETRPRITKAATTPITTSNLPHTRARASSIVSTSSSRTRVTNDPSSQPPPVPSLTASATSPLNPYFASPAPYHDPLVPSTEGGPGLSTSASIDPAAQSTPAISPRFRPSNLDSLPSLSQPTTPLLKPNLGIAHTFLQDPTASCPPTPLGPSVRRISTDPIGALERQGGSSSSGTGGRKRMPGHPFLVYPSTRETPDSPEMRTVELPPITPVTTRDADGEERRASTFGMDDGGLQLQMRRVSSQSQTEGGEGWAVVGLGIEHGLGDAQIDNAKLSNGGGTQDAGEISKVAVEGESGIDQDQSDGLVEEARINRKVADLEISNASLLAINRTLEISKSKQRAEILRLRRALRESLSNPLPHASTSSSSLSNATVYKSGLSPLSSSIAGPSTVTLGLTDDPAVEGGEEEDDLEEGIPALDPELEHRWAKVEASMLSMQKRAQAAVERINEEAKPTGRAVLSWEVDDEAYGDEGGSVGIGTPERHGEG